MTSQKVNLSLKITAEQVTPTEIGFGSMAARFPFLHELVFPQGTSSGKAEAMWGDTLSVGVGVTALDLNALSAVAGVGAVAFTDIKGIAIRNKSTSGSLTIGGGSGGSSAPNADSWSDTDAGVSGSPFGIDGAFATLGPGDVFLWTSKAGVDVVNATADKLGLEAFTATQTVEVLLWGDIT